MSRVVYLNGEYVEPEQAKVSIFDRGILFGDGIYEVAGVINGKLISFDHHMARLHYSLAQLFIPQPLSDEQILAAYRKLVEMNHVDEGMVYMQITRGSAERDFVYAKDLTPTVFMFTQTKPDIENQKVKVGVALKSVEDIRWARRDIKTVNLLGQVFAKQQAHDAGAYEALMIAPDGYVTECGSTSFYIIKDNTIITRPLSNDILPGVTRKSLLALMQKHNLKLHERNFTLDEVYNADEAFISGASTYVLPVTKVDGKSIGTGKPGNLVLELRSIYVDHITANAI